MTDQLKQTMQEELQKMPLQVANAINMLDWEKILIEIGNRFVLDEESLNNLEIETALVLIGSVDQDSYLSNIDTNVGLSSKEAEQIDQEVAEKIFNPLLKEITEKMKLNFSKENEEEEKPDWHKNIDFILPNREAEAGE